MRLDAEVVHVFNVHIVPLAKILISAKQLCTLKTCTTLGIVMALPLFVAAQTRELLAVEAGIRQVIERAEPSVACVLVGRSKLYAELQPPSPELGKLGRFDARKFVNRFTDPARVERVQRLDLSVPDVVPDAFGSAIVISAEGELVTPYHVVRDAAKIHVRLPNGTGSYADIVAADVRSDLAILQLLDVPAKLSPAKLGDGSGIRKGNFVVSIAHPFTSDFRDGSPSASWGIVSNIRRRPAGERSDTGKTPPLAAYGTLLQTDTRLHHAVSGAGLFDANGDCIALTTRLPADPNSEVPGGFAIPLDVGVKRILETLRKGREVEYGYLGVGIRPNERTILVDYLAEDGPAGKAGMMVGDRIRAVEGVSIDDTDTLFLTVGMALAGSIVKLEVERTPGGTRTLTVRLGKYPAVAGSIFRKQP